MLATYSMPGSHSPPASARVSSRTSACNSGKASIGIARPWHFAFRRERGDSRVKKSPSDTWLGRVCEAQVRESAGIPPSNCKEWTQEAVRRLFEPVLHAGQRRIQLRTDILHDDNDGN